MYDQYKVEKNRNIGILEEGGINICVSLSPALSSHLVISFRVISPDQADNRRDWSAHSHLPRTTIKIFSAGLRSMSVVTGSGRNEIS